jgi:hypothetical protein
MREDELSKKSRVKSKWRRAKERRARIGTPDDDLEE